MKKILAIILAIAVLGAGGYFTYKFIVVSETQEKLSDTVDESTLQSCKSTKQSVCMMNGEVTEENYPDSCFQNGENILEDPYTCSN